MLSEECYVSMNELQRFTFRKTERVTGLKRIEKLFGSGKSFMAYPLRIVYVYRALSVNQAAVAICVSVPKKRLKRAVHRNRIKRLVREAYRLNKHQFEFDCLPPDTGIDIGLVYVKDTLAEYVDIEKSVKKALREISAQMKKREKA